MKFQNDEVGNMTRERTVAEGSLLETDELEQYFYVLTSRIGPIPTNLESGLSIGVEVFSLTEGFEISSSSLRNLWQHSVRTGYIAALIAIHQQVDRSQIWQAFVGGLLHDIGMLMFLTQQPQVFMAVVDLAQSRGRELRTLEENFLGTTHAKSGAKFLARWGIPEELLKIVTFHDKPLQAPHRGFSPLTAVYIANILEGGGIAQDGDGVIDWEGEAYLLRLGLWDYLPLWQGWMRDLSFPLTLR